MTTLYVYSLETNLRVATIDGADNASCEAKAEAEFGSNDYGWTYSPAIARITEQAAVAMTGRRFILIESYNGFVWGEAIAETVVEACRAVDLGITCEPFEYAVTTADPRDSSGYYAVYDATGSNIVVDDGQDRELIAAVRALPFVGYVTRTPASDLPYQSCFAA